VQQGISEKVALVVHFISAFFTGYILAYARSWRLALALTSILPFIGITGALLNRFVSRYMQFVSLSLSHWFLYSNCFSKRLSLKYIAEGGSVAEEVISTIRTAQAFGTQKVLSGIYDGYVEKAHVVTIKSAAIHGSAMSSFFFAIYAGYALGMFLLSPLFFIV
jgi:ATP-binding cassette, subfamily B (MDR/TAP), member 1